MTDSTTVNKASAPVTGPGDDTSVRVAVRIRPQSAKERVEMCQVCTSVLPDEHQVFLGKDKAFTYDYVYDTDTTQQTIYADTARSLIDGTFEGYNATIFAYGQTGSGKTYTMGTGFDLSISPEEVGIIPRAVEHLFNGIDQRRQAAKDNDLPVPDFKVNAQFMELYNEEIHDLLDTTRDPQEKGKKSHIKIHEDAGGSIYTVGVTTRIVASLQDTMQCLNIGALSRTTASTNMNAQSSRSHAIFTLQIKQQRIVKAEEMNGEEESEMTSSVTNEFETLTAKFHFVDLAGSERLKRTGATGDRAKEGISINCGLLALGNVISALGDKTKKGSHVPYRDSKLTRLLQDSLGGNSQTLMIACVSPSDRDFMETLNTMKYANRARNIQNKVMVNQDKTSKQIATLRKEIAELQLELMEYKTGKRQVGEDGVESVSDMFHENTMLQTDNNSLRQRIKAMQETIETLTTRNTELLAEQAVMSLPEGGDPNSDVVTKMIQGYIREMEQLRSKLVESEAMVESIKRSSLRTPSRAGPSPMVGVAVPITSTSMDYTLDSRNDLIEQAKRDLRHMKKKSKRLKKVAHESDKENQSGDEDGGDQTRPMSGRDHEADDQDEDEEDEEGHEEEEEEMEEEENEDELELSSEGSETEGTETLHEDLADLTCEISIKEKLVEELELSQKRLHAMRVQYEEKLLTLQARIKETEHERDKVLANVGMAASTGQEKARKIRDDYQKKLNDMQSELRKLQAAKKEHAKVLRNQAHYERQLRTLQKDLGDLKQTKVKLMKQIKDESQRTRRSDLQHQKEVAQLRKEQRTKDTRISRLEAEKQQKEIVLRRKQEEVESLRKRQKPLSSKAAGRVGKYDQRPLSATQVAKVSTRRKKEFSPKAAKQKWDHLEKMMSTVVLKKQTLSHMERDMERWLKQRDTLSGKLEKFLRKKEKAVSEREGEETVGELAEQIDTLRANITYVQDNIADCQSSIMQMEEAKDDEADPASHFSVVNLEESKYLLEHFLNLVITKGLLASQKESENKALQAKLHQERMEHEFQTELLQYLIQQYPDQIGIVVDDSIFKDRPGDSDTGSGSSSGATSPLDSLLDEQFKPINPLTAAMLLPPAMLSGTTVGSGDSLSGRSKDKARRKTATPQELLGVNSGSSEASASLQSVPETSEKFELKVPVPVRPQAPAAPETATVPVRYEAATDGSAETDGAAPPTKMAPPPTTLVLRGAQAAKTPSPMSSASPSPSTATTKVPLPSPAVSKPSAASSSAVKNQLTSPSVAKVMPSVVSTVAKGPSAMASTSRQNGAMSRSLTGTLPEPSPSPSLMRRSYPAPGAKSLLPEPSPTMRRKANSSSSSLSRQSSVCSVTGDTVLTPPSSPLTSRRGRTDGNVFSRLTSSNTQSSPIPSRGTITPVAAKTAAPATPLVHSHTAEGHTKAVLSIFATEELLFSSSKDRTAKVWDLAGGREIVTLDGHPNNVVAVRYSPETRLAYTVSTYFIKVWDLRDANTCVRTLTSSGITNEGPLQINTTSRQLTCPAGETTINDIALNSTGTVLYSAAGNNVRIWELRNFKAVGKLSGGHQAAVMVLAVDDTDTADGNICVVTGSKDHYIKVFEMDEDSVGVMTPKYNLEPPHYDGIQSLCLGGDLLFSGSRDMCIKKWDLAEQTLQHSLNNSHKDWVCGLAFMPGGNCLLSGCRGGSLKVWHIDSCHQLADIQAHKSPINAITTNSNLIFTASNEAGIKMWEPVWECMPEDIFI